MGIDEKYALLKAGVRDAGRLAVAYSGGVDSTLLLAVAHEALGGDVLAVTVASPFMPQAECGAAEAFCAVRGIPLVRIEVDPLADDAIRANTPERCYQCKRALFSAVRGVAASEGCASVADGSNADDADDFRPGLRALRELGVTSPLMEAGLTKDDVRALSRTLGLPTADKPSMACLATRVPYGTALERETLARIEAAEDFLHGLGVCQLRVRDHGDVARIEVEPGDIERVAVSGIREQVDARLRELGYAHVSVDLAGFRSGSMNAGVDVCAPAFLDNDVPVPLARAAAAQERTGEGAPHVS